MELVYRAAPQQTVAQVAMLSQEQQNVLKKMLYPTVPDFDSLILSEVAKSGSNYQKIRQQKLRLSAASTRTTQPKSIPHTCIAPPSPGTSHPFLESAATTSETIDSVLEEENEVISGVVWSSEHKEIIRPKEMVPLHPVSASVADLAGRQPPPPPLEDTARDFEHDLSPREIKCLNKVEAFVKEEKVMFWRNRLLCSLLPIDYFTNKYFLGKGFSVDIVLIAPIREKHS